MIRSRAGQGPTYEQQKLTIAALQAELAQLIEQAPKAPKKRARSTVATTLTPPPAVAAAVEYESLRGFVLLLGMVRICKAGAGAHGRQQHVAVIISHAACRSQRHGQVYPQRTSASRGQHCPGPGV